MLVTSSNMTVRIDDLRAEDVTTPARLRIPTRLAMARRSLPVTSDKLECGRSAPPRPIGSRAVRDRPDVCCEFLAVHPHDIAGAVCASRTRGRQSTADLKL